MYDPFHGNFDLELNEGCKTTFTHTYIYTHLFTSLMTEIKNIEDFSKEAVIVFLEIIYWGDMEKI